MAIDITGRSGTMANMVRDRKTGRKRRVDPARSRAAKKGARKRRNKRRSPATIRKQKLTMRRTMKTGKTVSGRRVVKRRAAPKRRK